MASKNKTCCICGKEYEKKYCDYSQLDGWVCCNCSGQRIAIFVSDVSRNFNGTAKLYEINRKLGTRKYNHIVVSALNNKNFCETFIFPASADGNIIDWRNPEYSYLSGESNIEKALNAAGYRIIRR